MSSLGSPLATLMFTAGVYNCPRSKQIEALPRLLVASETCARRDNTAVSLRETEANRYL